MTNEVDGIDQGFRSPHLQVVNLDDNPNFILKTQPLESLERQTPIFVDSNDQVTPNHTSDQTFDIVSPRTRACNLLGIRSKPNKKATSKKQRLSREPPSLAEAMKKYSQKQRLSREPPSLAEAMKKYSQKQHLSREPPSLVEVMKKYSQIAKELELLKMQMTKKIMTQILESEQVGRKLLLEGQLQMVSLFVEVLKPRDPVGISFSTCGSI
jgi:hypothetical protein